MEMKSEQVLREISMKGLESWLTREYLATLTPSQQATLRSWGLESGVVCNPDDPEDL